MHALLRIIFLFILATTIHARGYAEEPPVLAKETEPRLVSISGALTEIIYSLQAQAALVGVDTTSLFPPKATELPQVGYHRQLSAEGILSLKPGIVLLTEEAGPPTVLQQLKEAGVNIITLPAEHSTEGVIKKIRGVAKAIDKTKEGENLVEKFKLDMEKATQSIRKNNKPKVAFLLNAGKGSPMAAGNHTAADAMIDMSGGINVFGSSYKGYKPVSAEAMIAANPDILLLTQRTLDGLGSVEKAIELPGIMLTTAGKNKRIVTMDGLYLLGFGPRLPDAVRTLSQLFHPKNPS